MLVESIVLYCAMGLLLVSFSWGLHGLWPKNVKALVLVLLAWPWVVLRQAFRPKCIIYECSICDTETR